MQWYMRPERAKASWRQRFCSYRAKLPWRSTIPRAMPWAMCLMAFQAILHTCFMSFRSLNTLILIPGRSWIVLSQPLFMLNRLRGKPQGPTTLYETLKASPLNSRRSARPADNRGEDESTPTGCPIWMLGDPFGVGFVVLCHPGVLRTPGYWEVTLSASTSVRFRPHVYSFSSTRLFVFVNIYIRLVQQYIHVVRHV